MSEPLTIAFVSDAVYPYNKGGKETRLHEVSTRLAKRGYNVHIYCMKWWQGKKDQLLEGIHFHGICPYLPLYSGERRSIFQGVVFGLSCVQLVSADFDVIDVDHMPFFPLYAVRVVCWLKRRKMIATWHEVWGKAYWQAYLGGWKGKIAAWIEAWSVHLPDTIFAVSEMTAGRVRDVLGYSGELVTVLNGIDLDLIQSVKKSDHQTDVIYAGRLLKHKNVDVLLQAVDLLREHLPDVKLLIVGDGPEKEHLVKLAKKLKLDENVEFLPFQDDIRDLYALMKGSQIFVLPSSREGFGIVVLEANACGLPVITVDEVDNAAKDLVQEGNGFLSDLNKASLEEHLRKYLTSKLKAASFIREKCLQYPLKYSWKRAIDQWERTVC